MIKTFDYIGEGTFYTKEKEVIKYQMRCFRNSVFGIFCIKKYITIDDIIVETYLVQQKERGQNYG